MDVEEEWYSTMKAFLESVHHGEMKFWDENILKDAGMEYITKMLELFVSSQNLNINRREQDEFDHFYNNLIAWMVKEMSWSKLSEKNLLKPYNKGSKHSSNYSCRDDKYQLFCEMTKDIESELKSYNFKYFIFHITLFLTRNVNIKGEWTYAHYNAAGRTFLFDFMECFYSKQVAKRVIQAMEKAIADFNYETLEFTDQNPLQTFLAPSFKNETDEYKVDMVAFIKGLSDKDKDFKDLVKYSQPMHRIGQKLTGMNDEFNDKEVSTLWSLHQVTIFINTVTIHVILSNGII